MSEELVWYASYGSNLSGARFMVYIRGGSPPGYDHTFPGCRDKSPPRDAQPVVIPHELYFGQYEQSLAGAVAFIERANRNVSTLGRMYLLTEQQFNDVVSQENKMSPASEAYNIDFTYLLTHEEYFLNPNDPSKPADENTPKWYGRLLKIGERQGFSICTFTAEWPDDFIRHIIGPPSRAYLGIIAAGLAETYGHSSEEIVNYLSEKRGIREKLTSFQIREWVTPFLLNSQ